MYIRALLIGNCKYQRAGTLSPKWYWLWAGRNVISWKDIQSAFFDYNLSLSVYYYSCLLNFSKKIIISKTILHYSVFMCCVISCFSCFQLLATLWTAPCRAPLSMGFSSQENRSGLQYPTPGNLPNAGIEPVSLTSAALAGGSLPLAPPGKPIQYSWIYINY